MDGVGFLDELSDDAPCHSPRQITSEGRNHHHHWRSSTAQDSAMGQAGDSDGDLPDLPDESAPLRSREGGDKPGPSPRGMLQATPVNVALQEKPAATPTPSKLAAVSVEITSTKGSTPPLPPLLHGKPTSTPTTAISLPSGAATPSRMLPRGRREVAPPPREVVPRTVDAAAAVMNAGDPWQTPKTALSIEEENAALRESLRALTVRVRQLEGQLLQSEDEQAGTATLLEENTAYMSTLKDRVASEQATRHAVEQRCQRIEAAFAQAQREMEEIQQELRRRLEEMTQRCNAAEAAAKQGREALAELQRLRAVIAFDSEAYKKLKEDFERANGARVAAEQAAEAVGKRAEDLALQLATQQHQREASQAAYEEERQEAKRTVESLTQQVHQMRREHHLRMEQHVLVELCLDGLVGWLQEFQSEAEGEDGEVADQTLASLLTREHLQELLLRRNEGVDAVGTPPPQQTTPLSSATLFRLAELAERVLGTVRQCRERHARAHATQRDTVGRAVTSLARATEAKWAEMERSLGKMESRLATAQATVDAWATVEEERRGALAVAAERSCREEEENRGLREELAQARMTIEDHQRLLRLQKVELRGVQDHCAILQDQLRLQEVFTSTRDAVQDLRRLTAQEIRAAVGDLIDATSGVGSGLAGIVPSSFASNRDADAMSLPSSERQHAFLMAVEGAVMKAEAHVELMRKAIGKAAGGVPTWVGARVPQQSRSPLHKPRVQFRIPAGETGAAVAEATALATNMTPRQHAIYEEMQRLIRSPPPCPSSLLTTSTVDPSPGTVWWGGHGTSLVMPGSGADDTINRSSPSPIFCYPSEEQRRVLQAEDHLVEVAETLVLQLQNLSRVLEHNADQCGRHSAAVVAALQAWECRIADGLEQCAVAIEEKVGRHFIRALATPQRVRRGTQAANPTPAPASRSVEATLLREGEERQATPLPPVAPHAGSSPLLLARAEAEAIVREDHARSPLARSGRGKPVLLGISPSPSLSPLPGGRHSRSPVKEFPMQQQRLPRQPSGPPVVSPDQSAGTEAVLASEYPLFAGLGQHHYRFRDAQGPPWHPNTEQEAVTTTTDDTLFMPRSGVPVSPQRTPSLPSSPQARRAGGTAGAVAVPQPLQETHSPTPPPPPPLWVPSLADALSGKRQGGGSRSTLATADANQSGVVAEEDEGGERDGTAAAAPPLLGNAGEERKGEAEEEPLTPTSAIVYGPRRCGL